MESQTLSPEQLDTLKGLSQTHARITTLYGELKYDQLSVNSQLADLEAQMVDLEVTRIETIRILQEQFGGTGTINFETGEFIPAVNPLGE